VSLTTFYFYGFLIQGLVAEIEAVLEMAKTGKYWWLPIFLWTQEICDVLAWRADTTRPGQYKALCAHISQAAVHPLLLSYYIERRQHLQEEKRTLLRSERSQLLWTLPGQNRKEMLPRRICI
jgi:hypothetical protein